MKALIFAYSEIGVTGLETLLELGVDVVGVVTHPDNPQEERWFRSVEALARSNHIPVQLPENANTPELLAWGKSLNPDVVFSFYYRQLLKPFWLDISPIGAFNLHGSLLPRFRGRACVNWAIIEGAKETGITLHEMIARADAGNIVAQERVSIEEYDTARRVFEKLVPEARRMLLRVVPLLRAGQAPRIPQVESEATTFRARKPEDGLIDWTWPASRVHNWVRALTHPYPGAFTLINGKKLFVWKGRVLKEKSYSLPGGEAAPPGTFLEPQSEGLPVVTGDGLFLIQEFQQEIA